MNTQEIKTIYKHLGYTEKEIKKIFRYKTISSFIVLVIIYLIFNLIVLAVNNYSTSFTFDNISFVVGCITGIIMGITSLLRDTKMEKEVLDECAENDVGVLKIMYPFSEEKENKDGNVITLNKCIVISKEENEI